MALFSVGVNTVTRDPETGERNLTLLRMMKQQKGLRESVLGTGVCLGVYARVSTPGIIRVGDGINVSG
ncbi:MOSC domain-containing protein [Arthrobacter sp. S39]|nr:MOSC domain-containing protein [Arthrobacter sp. S39]